MVIIYIFLNIGELNTSEKCYSMIFMLVVFLILILVRIDHIQDVKYIIDSSILIFKRQASLMLQHSHELHL